MPAIADPFASRHYHGPARRSPRPRADRVPTSSLGVRLTVAAHRGSLTEALADGASVQMGEALGLRARQVTSERNRRAIARALRRVIEEAHKPMRLQMRVVIIRRSAVLAAEDALVELIRRLENSEPVRAQGAAEAELILTDGSRSPLYNPGQPGALLRAARAARADLELDPSRGHEFLFSV